MNNKLEKFMRDMKNVDLESMARDIIDVDGKGRAEDLAILTEALHIAYNKKGESLIPDALYDVLFELNKIVNGITLVGVQSPTIKKYPHRYPSLRGTVDKIHFILEKDKGAKEKRKSYQKWVEMIEKTLGISLKGKRIRASLKVDGVSAIIEGKEGLSTRVLKRGDTENNEAENIPLLENRFFPDLKDVKEFGLKTELYMTYERFEEFKAKYGEFNSPRSAITSIINSDEVNEDHLQYIIIYDIEQILDGETVMPDNLHFELPDMTNYVSLQAIVNTLQEMAAVKNIPADGVVIKILDEEIQELLGRDGAINKFEVGYKFPAVRQRTYLKDVIFSMGKQGSYTPVALIEPVTMSGNKVSRVSLGSIPRFLEMDLRYGQPVNITYDVIPYLYDSYTEEKENYPDKIPAIIKCEICEEHLDYKDSRLYCGNYDCPGNLNGRLLTWVTKTGMEGISYATIEDLINGLKIDKRGDLYRIQYYRKDLEAMKGYGPESAENIISSIQSKSELPADIFIGSLGIENVGRKTMKTIFTHHKFSDFFLMIMKLDFSELISIKGIGDSVINSLRDWFADDNNMEEFNDLLKLVKVHDPAKTVDSHTILFTKVRDYDFQKYLEEKGYAIADKYSKEVDVVIAGAESKKTEKALKDGKMVINLEQAHEIYKYKG